MHNHKREEHRIKPRKGTLKSTNQSPRNSKIHITSIMDLSCPRVDAGDEDGVALGCGEVFGVVKSGEGKLWEGFADYRLVALERAETICERGLVCLA